MLKRRQFLKWPALIIVILGACHCAPSRTAIPRDKMQGVWLTDVAVLGLTYITKTLNHILAPVTTGFISAFTAFGECFTRPNILAIAYRNYPSLILCLTLHIVFYPLLV